MNFLDELKELDEAATGAPWNEFSVAGAIGVTSRRSDVAWVRCEKVDLFDTARTKNEDKTNAALIAFLRNHASAIAGLVESMNDSTELLAALAEQAGESRGQLSQQVTENRAALSRLNEGAK